MKHPLNVAKVLANMLESDPVSAAQIKEHLTTDRILELLALPEDDLRYYAHRNDPVLPQQETDE